MSIRPECRNWLYDGSSATIATANTVANVENARRLHILYTRYRLMNPNNNDVIRNVNIPSPNIFASMACHTKYIGPYISFSPCQFRCRAYSTNVPCFIYDSVMLAKATS